jgi:Rod binding domain-containing protein
MSEGLPPIDLSVVPANVRSQGTAAVQKYDTALSFEGVLDQQLTQALASTLQDTTSSGDDSDDTSSSDPGTSLLLQELPQQLSQSLVSSGGLGLASQLYTALGGTFGTPQAAATSSTPSTEDSGSAS